MTHAFASATFRVPPPFVRFCLRLKPSPAILRVTSSAVDQTSSRYYYHFRLFLLPPFCLTVVCVTDDSGDLTSCCWIISLSLLYRLNCCLIFSWRSEFGRSFFFPRSSFVFRRLFSPLPPFYTYNPPPFRLCVNELALKTPPSTIVYIYIYIYCA